MTSEHLSGYKSYPMIVGETGGKDFVFGLFYRTDHHSDPGSSFPDYGGRDLRTCADYFRVQG